MLECPYCHESYAYRLRNKRYTVTCKTSYCKRVFYIGLRILVADRGDVRGVPSDMIVPVLRWRDEKRLNELIELQPER